MPPKLVPTSMPAKARKNRALPSSAMIAMVSADQLNSRPVAKVGMSAGGDPGRGEYEIGNEAEQPGRAMRDHRLLARQPGEIAIGLSSGGPRRRSRRAFTLRTRPVSKGASNSTSNIWEA